MLRTMDIASPERLADPHSSADNAAGRDPHPGRAPKRRRIRVPKPEFAFPAATLDAMAALMAQVPAPAAAVGEDRGRTDRETATVGGA